MAYLACSIDPNTPVTITSLANYLGVSERTTRERIKVMSNVFRNDRGVVTLKQ